MTAEEAVDFYRCKQNFNGLYPTLSALVDYLIKLLRFLTTTSNSLDTMGASEATGMWAGYRSSSLTFRMNPGSFMSRISALSQKTPRKICLARSCPEHGLTLLIRLSGGSLATMYCTLPTTR